MIWAIFYVWGLEPQITQISQMTQMKENLAQRRGDAERKLRSLRPGGSARDLFYPLTLGAGVIYLVG